MKGIVIITLKCTPSDAMTMNSSRFPFESIDSLSTLQPPDQDSPVLEKKSDDLKNELEVTLLKVQKGESLQGLLPHLSIPSAQIFFLYDHAIIN